MKLLDQVRHTAHARHFSFRTEQAFDFLREEVIRCSGT